MMTLGNRIQQLRKEHNMSQGDLADALDISRQSVSKWETDTATPDLDKVLKLSEVFHVTLDELVKGKSETKEETNSTIAEPIITETIVKETIVKETIPVEIKAGLQPRQIVGIILLCMAFFCALLCTALGGFLEGLLFSLPFTICGVICLLVSKHTGLCCAWAINIMLDIFLRTATGASYSMVFSMWSYQFANPIALAIGWAHFLFIVILIVYTIRVLSSLPIDWNKNKQTWLIVGWIIYLALHLPITNLLMGRWALLAIAACIISLSRMILFPGLIAFTINWNRWRKSK